MQLPKRKSQLYRKHGHDEGPLYMTTAAAQRIHDEIKLLETRDRPQAVEDVSRSVQLGDLSENAEYQEAKSRLSRIDGRLFSLRERLKRVEIIHPSAASDGRVRLGAHVTVEVYGQSRNYQIVGPHEARPEHGRISHVSPLGEALMDHVAGDTIVVETPKGKISYRITEVR